VRIMCENEMLSSIIQRVVILSFLNRVSGCIGKLTYNLILINKTFIGN